MRVRGAAHVLREDLDVVDERAPDRGCLRGARGDADCQVWTESATATTAASTSTSTAAPGAGRGDERARLDEPPPVASPGVAAVDDASDGVSKVVRCDGVAGGGGACDQRAVVAGGVTARPRVSPRNRCVAGPGGLVEQGKGG